LSRFLQFLTELDKTLLVTILNAMNLAEAEKHWVERLAESKRLQKPRKKKRYAEEAVQELIRCCAWCSLEVRGLAGRVSSHLGTGMESAPVQK
jgi:hypothetical protein